MPARRLQSTRVIATRAIAAQRRIGGGRPREHDVQEIDDGHRILRMRPQRHRQQTERHAERDREQRSQRLQDSDPPDQREGNDGDGHIGGEHGLIKPQHAKQRRQHGKLRRRALRERGRDQACGRNRRDHEQRRQRRQHDGGAEGPPPQRRALVGPYAKGEDNQRPRGRGEHRVHLVDDAERAQHRRKPDEQKAPGRGRRPGGDQQQQQPKGGEPRRQGLGAQNPRVKHRTGRECQHDHRQRGDAPVGDQAADQEQRTPRRTTASASATRAGRCGRPRSRHARSRPRPTPAECSTVQ